MYQIDTDTAGKYLHLHADCLPVKGATRSAFYDLTRKELVFFPTEYMDVLDYLRSDTIGNVLAGITDDEEREAVLGFIFFLDRQEMICFVQDPGLFPPVPDEWDTPTVIHNAIIDVDAEVHDFRKLFRELDLLMCRFVQIRAYSTLLTPDRVTDALEAACDTSVEGVELILKYDPSIADADYIRLVERFPIVSSFVLHSAPAERWLRADYGCDEERARYIARHIYFSPQCIDGPVHCGQISQAQLCAPSVTTFFELRRYNGCLNRKLSVDTQGTIRNCPSMPQAYGNIRNTSLLNAVAASGFSDVWAVAKDRIAVCRDCELRYACTDCRAYLEDPGDPCSKPLKCGYNPYTGEWEDWSTHPAKQAGRSFYGLDKIVAR